MEKDLHGKRRIGKAAAAQKRPMKKIRIDYLYLDLKTCDRCVGTDAVLKKAFADAGDGAAQAYVLPENLKKFFAGKEKKMADSSPRC